MGGTSSSNTAHRIHVVVPAYKCERWIGRAIESIRGQRGVDFRCIVIDDCSGDATHARAREAAGDDERIRVVRREQRVYQLANRIFGIREIVPGPEDVVVLVDGDDWLAHEHALARIAREYADPDVWVTYGSYRSKKAKWRYRLGLGRRRAVRPYPDEIVRARTFRRWRWPGVHPKTFRRFLFDAIRDEDLRDETGAYYEAGTDLALMLPMFEMAGTAHLRWLREVLYIRNKLEARIYDPAYRERQSRASARLRSSDSPLYPELTRSYSELKRAHPPA